MHISKFIKTSLSILLIALAMPSLALAHEEGTEHPHEYTIYVHADCPHCKKVEDFVARNGIEDEIQYLQLKNNDSNMQKLTEQWDKFEISDNDRGWPFMVYTDENGEETYSSGDTPIIAVLKNDFQIVEDEVNSSTSSGSSAALLGVGGLVLLAIFGYGIYNTLMSDSGTVKKK